MSKKVLIITYYWPPSGGAGVQRWLKFVKYLPTFGWTPVVYTPSNPENPVEDESLLKDIPSEIQVIKKPIWEPYAIYKQLIGQKPQQKINAGFLSEQKKPGAIEKLAVWIRGNFFIPDARRFWIRPSVEYLLNYIEEHPVDLIVSTGPPHSMHLIALALKEKLGIPWVADFRDPWTNIDFYKDLMLTRWADRYHHQLEKKVVTQCDYQIVIGEGMRREFLSIGSKHIEVISNGYDEEDESLLKEISIDKKFSIVHVGSIPRSRNPIVLWRVLSLLVKENRKFAEQLEIKLIGKLDLSVIESLRGLDLMKYLTRVEYLPHNQVSKIQREAQVLLLAVNNTPNARGILTGKFFEYLSAKRPVLAIGPEDGEVARILDETKAGCISGFSNEKGLKEIILQYYQSYCEGSLQIASTGIEQYSRRYLTGKLVQIFNMLTVS